MSELFLKYFNLESFDIKKPLSFKKDIIAELLD
jgi:hypothetical protein